MFPVISSNFAWFRSPIFVYHLLILLWNYIYLVEHKNETTTLIGYSLKFLNDSNVTYGAELLPDG